jgi:hypothetical protein
MKSLKAISSILAISAFMYYQYVYVNTGVLPDEVFFIGSALSISAFAFLSIKWTDGIFITSLQLLTSSFFAVVVFIYVYRWVLNGDGTTNYYTAACWSALFTLIYSICYAIRNNPFFKHK